MQIRRSEIIESMTADKGITSCVGKKKLTGNLCVIITQARKLSWLSGKLLRKSMLSAKYGVRGGLFLIFLNRKLCASACIFLWPIRAQLTQLTSSGAPYFSCYLNLINSKFAVK